MYNKFTKKSLPPKSKKHKGQPIFSEKDHRVIAYVFGEELHKHLKKIMYNPPAIATDIEALRKGEQAGAKICVVTNKSNGIIYRASIEKIWQFGWVVNWGFGDQQALSLSHWLQTRDPNHKAHEDQTQALPYSEPNNTTEIMPLEYESHATVGIVRNGVHQLDLFKGE